MFYLFVFAFSLFWCWVVCFVVCLLACLGCVCLLLLNLVCALKNVCCYTRCIACYCVVGYGLLVRLIVYNSLCMFPLCFAGWMELFCVFVLLALYVWFVCFVCFGCYGLLEFDCFS